MKEGKNRFGIVNMWDIFGSEYALKITSPGDESKSEIANLLLKTMRIFCQTIFDL